MRTSRFILLVFLALSNPAGLNAAVFKQAEVTRVLNDVRVVPQQAEPAPARIGDVIRGKTAVATGVQSRAELRFPDKTLTRLGANTLFRLEEGTRDIDLERGVLMLQVPKQLGGARVRTAAVTAAVTGTTILIEYQPDGYIKVIVIEGELDLYLRESPSTFINLKAGDMILMKPDAKSFPLPVQVDLERLLATSKLLDPNEFGPVGNDKQIANALSDQDEKKKDGELMKTAFMLPGRGTQVTLTNEVRREILRFQKPGSTGKPPETTQNPGSDTGGGPPPRQPGSPDVRSPRPYIPGTTVITDNDPIITNPHITAYNSLADDRVTASGFFYDPAAEGAPGRAIFDRPATPTELDTLVSAAGVWTAFHFEDLVINGNPVIDSVNGVRHLLLASELGISLQQGSRFIGDSESALASPPLGSGTLVIDSSLDSFMLASNTGHIVVDEFFTLQATGNQKIIFQTFGANADIVIDGGYGGNTHIDAPEGSFHASAGRDIQFHGAGVRASDVTLHANRDVVLQTGTNIGAANNLKITANRGITVTDSTQLYALSETDPLKILIEARGGDLSITGDASISADEIVLESKIANLIVANSTISGDVIRARTLGANGELIIDGANFYAASLLRLYAEGSNGHIRFISNSTLESPRTDIAANSVTINSGVDVTVSNPSGLNVYTNNANYNRPSAPNSNGRFRDGSGSTIDAVPQAFGNRPSFNAP